MGATVAAIPACYIIGTSNDLPPLGRVLQHLSVIQELEENLTTDFIHEGVEECVMAFITEELHQAASGSACKEEDEALLERTAAVLQIPQPQRRALPAPPGSALPAAEFPWMWRNF